MKPNVTTPLLCILLGVSLLAGCKALTPGADPLVVRVEQTQRIADSTFDMVLKVDHSDRAFWKANVPAFHNLAEWLRTPLPYQGTNVPRCIVMQFNLDDAKMAYKASRNSANSNVLYAVWSSLDTVLSQSGSWLNIITNKTYQLELP